MREFLPANLQHLCNHYRSIAEVCRKLAISRGQFNKYLNGRSLPCAFNLKRICDFFGVEEYEIGLPTEQFLKLIGTQSNRSVKLTPSQRSIDHLQQQSSPQMRALLGYYYEYSYAMTERGFIVCSLVHVRESDGCFIYERNERSQSNIPGVDDAERSRYKGSAYYLQDRLFFIDYESLTSNEISQTILIPSFKSRITRLNGLKMGVSACDHRKPVCSRVVWHFLGLDIDRQSAFLRVGLHRADDEQIDSDLKGRLVQARVVDGLFQLV
ncbi:helix-turn-helix domain-containing protein [Pseudomonas sp. LB3P25]|nr:helix-turn-helix transcriptional regulator [Pseudomonas caspiana]TPG90346.1 XRE family transcriptional regulator [Pseudomonas caspiana]